MPSRVVIDTAIGQLSHAALASAHNGEGAAWQPGLSSVVAVDSGIVHLREVFPPVPGLTVIPGGPKKPSLVLSPPQGDAMLGHVHGQPVPALGGVNDSLLDLPGLAMIPAPIDRRRWRVSRPTVLLREYEDVPALFIYRYASAAEDVLVLAEDNWGAPPLPSILAATNLESFS